MLLERVITTIQHGLYMLTPLFVVLYFSTLVIRQRGTGEYTQTDRVVLVSTEMVAVLVIFSVLLLLVFNR